MNCITKNTIELCNTLKSEEDCSIEISKDNKYIARIKKDDKLRYIGSKYSVERDIEKFINDINLIKANKTIVVFGLGTGEHIKYLANSLSKDNKIFIVEPNAEIIKETFKLNEIKTLLEDDRIALCFLDNKIKKYINDFIDDYDINNLKIISFANYSSIFENEYNSFRKQFEQVKISRKMVADTFNEFSDEFFNNFIENIFTLANEGFYSINQLKNLYKDKPAVIVSAGPSLNKNVHLLKDVQDKFIIICGPRTIGTLIENDITPDFICSVDPQDKVYTLMEKYIDFKVPLVFMDSSDSRIVKGQKGSRIIVANQGMERYLEDMLGVEVDSLIQGGSVAHFSMGLATYLGCNTVIFIGQDLAYTNDKFQADGTYAGEMDKKKYDYEKDKEKWDNDKNFNVYVKDICGNPIRTSVVLKSYIDEFEDLISECNPRIKFINSTEGGANINGTEIRTLKDSIDLYAVEEISKKLQNTLERFILINKEQFTKRILEITNKLEFIKKSCEEGLKYSDQMLNFFKDNKQCDLNRIFLELDRIDEIINDRDNLGILAYSLVSIIDNLMKNEYFKEKENETEKELGVKSANRSFMLYAVVLEAVEDMSLSICEKGLFFTNLESKKNALICNSGIELKNFDVIVGEYDNDIEKMNIYTKSIISDNVKKNMSITFFGKLDILSRGFYLKYSIENNGYIYINFYDNLDVNFYEKVKKNEKVLNEYSYDVTQYYSLYIAEGYIGYIINKYGAIVRKKLKSIEKTQKYEIYFDLKNECIFVNDEIVKINKYFIEKYIISRRVGIIVTSDKDKSKLSVEDIRIYK